jgi:hypothetical protein
MTRSARRKFGRLKFTHKDEYWMVEHFYVFIIEMFLHLGCGYYSFIKKNRFVQVTSYFKGTWQYTILLSHLKELLRLYVLLLPFFYVLLTSTNILIERNEMFAIFNFCRYACHVTTGVTQYFYLDNH